MMTRTLHRYAPSIAVAVTAVVVLLAGPMLVNRLQFSHERAQAQLARRDLQSMTVLDQLNQAYETIARAVGPSVVHITVDRSGGRMLGAFSPPAQGSGWVYDEQGHIITNHHVIDGAQRIDVRFADGLPHRATLVGSDPETDIAVLRVTGRRVVPAQRATGKPVKQGDMVFAFGSPFGFEFSMSSGVVSGHGRQSTFRPGAYENYIQTDAAINPGNSGGPLTNIHGEVVGMNMAIAVPRDPLNSGRFTGIGLAIPLDMIEFVVEQIISGQPIQRGGLGIDLDNLDFADAERIARLGLRDNGVLVTGVLPNSPADAAGLRRDDVILALNGEPVTRVDALRTRIHSLSPSSVVHLTIWQDRERREIEVTLGDWSRIAADYALAAWGLRVGAATEARGGPVIEHVETGSRADRLGLEAGMVILTLNGAPVRSVNALADLLGELRPRTTAEFLVLDARGRQVQRRGTVRE